MLILQSKHCHLMEHKQLSKRFELISVFLLTFMMFPLLSITIVNSTDLYTPLTLTLNVYSDGNVIIRYDIITDSTYPTINVSLFGKLIEDLLVIDEVSLPLSYVLNDSNLTIYSLGAEHVEISYLTQEITEKSGRYWHRPLRRTGCRANGQVGSLGRTNRGQAKDAFYQDRAAGNRAYRADFRLHTERVP